MKELHHRHTSIHPRTWYITLRSELLWALRTFFHRHEFLEIEPPCVVVSPGLEPQLDAFEVHAPYAHAHTDGSRRWLHTSPEYALKRLLGEAGSSLRKIYALTPCFRDEPPSNTHSPEFSMLEWYTRDLQLDELMTQCEELICSLADVARARRSSDSLDHWLKRDVPFERLSVQEAFLRYAQIDLGKCPDVDTLCRAAIRSGLPERVLHGSWDEIYFQIFMDLVEPKLGQSHPTFLYDFPASQAALANLKPEDPRWALRFELFAAGHELANAFDELSHSEEQRARFEADLDIRAVRGAQQPPMDNVLLQQLPNLGHCVGIALGFDRLVMALSGAQTIDEVRLQSWGEP